MLTELISQIGYVIDAHTNHPRSPTNAVRLWDKETPYAIHPVWCAMTILTETNLPKNLREGGALVLFYHDVLEDTNAPLPNDLTPAVKQEIYDMTFPGGIEQEMREIWNKGNIIRLYKLYDKVSNLLDASWMPPELHNKYIDYTRKLLHDVEQNFGSLNIVKIAHAIIDTL